MTLLRGYYWRWTRYTIWLAQPLPFTTSKCTACRLCLPCCTGSHSTHDCRYNPIKTIKTSFLGTMNMLGLAKRTRARFLLTSTSEVQASDRYKAYGAPMTHCWPACNRPLLGDAEMQTTHSLCLHKSVLPHQCPACVFCKDTPPHQCPVVHINLACQLSETCSS